MKFKYLAAALGLVLAGQAHAQIAAWDFFGESVQVTSAADVFNANLDSSSNLTRGATAAASAGGNSFRTTGFSNNGISTANTDYFQFTLSSTGGYALSLSTIDARFAGTASYRASPGASGQFAYSLDGTTFTLIGTAFALTTDTTMPQISLTGISALQNVAASTTVTFRYYATGQTTTGGWGFNSPTAGTYGLAIGGSLAISGGSTVSIGTSGATTFTPSSFGGAAFTNLDTANFNSGAGVVTLSGGAVSAAGLLFTTTGYELAGSGANTISTPAVQVDGSSATISAEIAGANQLNKTGTGTLVLSGANTFTGNVTATAGTLSISADNNLGNAANDIVLSGGTLAASTSVSLGAGRDLSGTGTLAVSGADVLTFNGTVNANPTLSGTGTVNLAGPTNTLTGLTFTAGGTLNVTGGGLTLTGITTSQSAGTATIMGPITLATGAARTFTVGDGLSSTDLLIPGAITSTVRLSKQGAGTLQLTGDNSGMTGVQLGVQGAAPIDGGRLLVNSANALGATATQAQLNYGTLESTSAFIRGGGVSIGGRTGGFLTFAGSNMTFTGVTGSVNSFFKATGTTGELVLKANNTTTLNGLFAATSGSGTTTGITVGGSGTLVIASDASLVAERWATSDTVNFSITSGGKIGAGGMTIASGTTLTMGILDALTFATINGNITYGGTFNLDLATTDHGSWALGTGTANSGAFTGVSIIGSGYGTVSLTDMGGGVWSGVSPDTLTTFTLTAGVGGLSFAAVPEPQEYGIALAGMLVVAVLLRRRANARQA